jgi:hypothetical protein
MWITEGFGNESDVEQKFIYPLLVVPAPAGLGIPPEAIQTKKNIKRLAIGKGGEQKVYYPDYLIIDMGLPLVVIEAKAPGHDLEEAFRQARLYGCEVNSLYDHGFSPVKFAVATNGEEILVGYCDSQEAIFRRSCKEIEEYSQALSDLIDLLSWVKIKSYSDALLAQVKPSTLFKPRKLLGGSAIQNQEIPANKFGLTLTSSVSHIFNPQNFIDRQRIVKSAYVASRRRERFVEPIDRVIRAAKTPSDVNAQKIEDTAKPRELLGKLSRGRELEHKVLLLVGSVGSGKTTFIDYLQEVALVKDHRESVAWCRINMNNAPVNPSEIYAWLREEIISCCRDSMPSTDFDDLDTILNVYGVEVSAFKKGVGKLYEGNQQAYNEKLAEHLEIILADRQKVANAHVRYTCGERGKLCIIVLDNCDKKNRDEQLLMFEVAQWTQKQFRSLVILPLRDETYDNHRDSPPLDTVLKDMVFRIEPPLFQHVLMRRVQLALHELGGEGGEKLSYGLPNGFHVDYPKSEQGYYLTSIIKSLFEHDRFARRMIVGLSGRNIRKALELFLEFCNSGYIGEDQIFKIRQAEGKYALPLSQVATVLIRMNRRYYDSGESYIKNLFLAEERDVYPAYFCRYMILKWLSLNFKKPGSASIPGYFPKREIKNAIIPYGLSPEIIDRELLALLSARCIIAEHLKLDTLAEEDLVRIGPAGFVHLDLIGNIDYLAAISEDTYFDDRKVAELIVSGIKSPETHLHFSTTSRNAAALVDYLEVVKSRLSPPKGDFMESSLLSALSELEDAKRAIDAATKSQSHSPWFNADKKLKRGERYQATVVNIVPYGCFVEFDIGLTGLVHKTKMGGFDPGLGDLVQVEVGWVDVIKKQMGLKMTACLEEEVGDLFPSYVDAAAPNLSQ